MRSTARAWCAALVLGAATLAATRPAGATSAAARFPSAAAGRQSPACPAALGGALATSGAASRVPPAPSSALLCLYSGGARARADRSGGAAELDGWPARALAEVLAGEPATRGRACPPIKAVVVTIAFRSPRASAIVAVVECSSKLSAFATVDGVRRSVDPALSDDLVATAGKAARGGGPAPSLYGDTASAAQVATRRRRLSVVLGGEEIDPSVASGVVLLQSPLPGQPDLGQVSVLLSAHAAAPCTAGALGAQYVAGEPGAGEDFGTIVLRDTSTRPCTLVGPVRVVGTTGAGAADTAAVVEPVNAHVVLTPRAPRVPAHEMPSPGEVVAEVSLSAEYRDDPRSPNGLCSGQEVVPALWRLTVGGGEIVLVNSGGLSRGGLRTCAGRLGSPATVVAG